MPSTLDILSATYRTLDVTNIVRDETRGVVPPNPVEIDLWSVIPWSNSKLLEAPHPTTLVVVWRISLGNGCYTAPQTSTASGHETLRIEFDSRAYRESSKCMTETNHPWILNATYYDCASGFKNVTAVVAAMVERSPSSTLAIPISDQLFDGSKSSNSQCTNQLCVTFGLRDKKGDYTFECVAGSTGSTLCVQWKGEEVAGTVECDVRRRRSSDSEAAQADKMVKGRDKVQDVSLAVVV